MSNQMISVPRDLIAIAEKFISAQADNFPKINRGQRSRALSELSEHLRALLAKPAEQHQGEPVFYAQTAKVENPSGWRGLIKAEMDSANGYTIPLYTRPAEQPAQKYDDTLLPFMELMRRELKANSHKGDRDGWLGMTAATAFNEITHHHDKLGEALSALDYPQISEYAADVANCCMMLLDICGELAFVKQPAPGCGGAA